MALFGGFTPLVSTWLIEATGNKAAPRHVDGLRWCLRAGRYHRGLQPQRGLHAGIAQRSDGVATPAQ
jgi:hypothetical protein